MLLGNTERPMQHNDIPMPQLRALIVAAFLAYPAGCIWLLNVSTESFRWPEALGYALILVALFAAAAVIGSRWQRIVGEDTRGLDERELLLNFKANTFAFRAITLLALLFLVYCGIAADTAWWRPSAFDHWNALFWAVMLYATLLPTAYVAWTQRPLDEE